MTRARSVRLTVLQTYCCHHGMAGMHASPCSVFTTTNAAAAAAPVATMQQGPAAAPLLPYAAAVKQCPAAVKQHAAAAVHSAPALLYAPARLQLAPAGASIAAACCLHMSRGAGGHNSHRTSMYCTQSGGVLISVAAGAVLPLSCIQTLAEWSRSGTVKCSPALETSKLRVR